MDDNITLIGMPGSGKSTVGVVLAKMTGREFVDVDLLIQQREGALLQQIIDTQGNDALLQCEEDAVCSIRTHHAVIAPGGSVIYRPRSMEHLHRIGAVVYLDLGLDELLVRLGDISRRGITLAPGQTIVDLYAERVPLYRKYADLAVDCSGRQRIEDTARNVVEALRERGEKRN